MPSMLKGGFDRQITETATSDIPGMWFYKYALALTGLYTGCRCTGVWLAGLPDLVVLAVKLILLAFSNSMLIQLW